MFSLSRRPAALAAAVLVLMLAVPAGASAQGETTWIAYTKLLPTGGAQIFVANPDGSGEHLVPTADPAEDFGVPVWSPDGSSLLISNMLRFDGQGDLLPFRPSTVNPDGSNYHLVPAVDAPFDMYCHAWTANGTRLLCGLGGDHPGIFSVRATDGGDARRLTTNPFGSGDVAWSVSPDGSQFAFLRYRPGPVPGPQPFRPEAVGIFVANIDGSHIRQVVPYGQAQAHETASASWSPDGKLIASSTKSGRLFVVRVDGTGLRQLTLDVGSTNTFAIEPAWSPDGSRMIFTMFRDGQPDLYTADPDGSHVVQVTDTPDFENGPSWARSSN
jgi:Tol biopolymer transport system component